MIMPARIERWELISAGNLAWLIRSRAVSSDGRGENREFRDKELGDMHVPVPIGGDDRESARRRRDNDEPFVMKSEKL